MSEAVLQAAKAARTKAFASASPSPSPSRLRDTENETTANPKRVYQMLNPYTLPLDDVSTSVPAATIETPLTPVKDEVVRSPADENPTSTADEQPPKPEPTPSDDADRADMAHIIEKPKESAEEEGKEATATAETLPLNSEAAIATNSSAASPAVDKDNKPSGRAAPPVKRQRQTKLG